MSLLQAARSARLALWPAAAAGLAGAAFLASEAATASADAAQQAPAGLNAKEFVDLRLAAKRQLTHNSWELRFELPPGSQQLTVASCLLTKASIQGAGDDKPKVVVRPYTPVSAPEAPVLDLVVKSYEQGKMSKHMCELKVGDTLAFKGPILKFAWAPNKYSHVGLVAGGTGITPCLQVAEHVLGNPADKTKVSLVFANVSEDDILLKDRIDALAAAHPGQFSAHYVVDKPKWGGIFWKGGVGYVTRDMLAAHMPPPGAGSLVMVCGPPGQMAAVCGDKAPDKSQGPLAGLLKQMGYDESMVFKF